MSPPAGFLPAGQRTLTRFGPWEGADQGWEGSGKGDSYGNYHFATRSLPAPVERLRQVDRMVLQGYQRFFRNPMRLTRYIWRHPNKLLALDNLAGVLRNIAAYHRERWTRRSGAAQQNHRRED